MTKQQLINNYFQAWRSFKEQEAVKHRGINARIEGCDFEVARMQAIVEQAGAMYDDEFRAAVKAKIEEYKSAQ